MENNDFKRDVELVETVGIQFFLQKPVWVIFLVSWLFYFFGLFLFSHFVWDDNLYLENSRNNGAQFDQFISNVRYIDIIRYVLSPIWIIGISSLIWVFIKSGLLITQTEISASLLFKIILLGCIILSLPFWIKAIWLILITGSYSPADVKNFYPGSIVPFLNVEGMNEIEIKTWAHVNLYHLGFMIFTAWEISENSELRFFKSLLLVISTYGLGILLLRCLIFVMFV